MYCNIRKITNFTNANNYSNNREKDIYNIKGIRGYIHAEKLSPEVGIKLNNILELFPCHVFPLHKNDVIHYFKPHLFFNYLLHSMLLQLSNPYSNHRMESPVPEKLKDLQLTRQLGFPTYGIKTNY
ncbi:hypothetical protein P3S68_007208 [Capsicum galapagoense]